MKRFFSLLAIVLIGFLISACDNESVDRNDNSGEEAPMIYLTLEALKAFDGKEGRDAYIAVDGKIYDVTNSVRWRNGEHNGFKAGNDLTEALGSESPHGDYVLNNVPLIGEIVEE